MDGTGLESRHTSRYFFKRAGRKHTSRLWTKLTVATDTGSHFFAGATATTGPSNDSPQFRPVMAQASLVITWDRVLADAAFDSEEHHRYGREDLGVRSTVFVPGQIADPVTSRFGVHLIQLLERRQSALTQREQREVARNIIKERKLDEAYVQWAQEVRGRAYVELREPPQ